LFSALALFVLGRSQTVLAAGAAILGAGRSSFWELSLIDHSHASPIVRQEPESWRAPASAASAFIRSIAGK
jgi:hypothetical protein